MFSASGVTVFFVRPGLGLTVRSTTTAMKQSNLNGLIKKYLSGETTEQETAKLEAWLDVMKTGEGTDMELSAEEEEILFRKITSNIDRVEDVVRFRQERTKLPPLKAWMQMAAAVLVLLMGSYTVWHFAFPPDVFEVVAVKELDKTILRDGTIVWLRKDAKLSYQEGENGARQASLVGEGLFEVAKDAEHPFSVACGKVTVRVVGTSFSLNAGSDSVVLKVLTGKVNVSASGNATGVDVLPNEKMLYVNGKIERASLDSKEVAALPAFKEYDMRFENTPMATVIDRIEKKFDVRVDLKNEALKKCRITADLTDHSLEKSWALMAEIFEMEYAIVGNTVTVSGSGCN